MLVKDWMSKEVITAKVTDSMRTAINLMRKHDIRMMPVMENGRLAGVVTDRDLKGASASSAGDWEFYELSYLLEDIKISEIMTKNPVTAPVDYTIEETAELLLKHKISGLPVVNHDDRVVGVITQADVFKVIVSLTGLSKRGVLFALRLEDRPELIDQAADIIRKYGGHLASVLSSFQGTAEGRCKAYIRMYGVDRHKLPQLKEELKEIGDLLYLVDLNGPKREIF